MNSLLVSLFIPGSRAQLARKQDRGSGCRFVSHLDGPRHRVCCAPNASVVAAPSPVQSVGSSPSDAATQSDHRRRCSPPTPRSPS